MYVLAKPSHYHNLVTQYYISIQFRNSAHSQIKQIVKYV